jgi:hypothetical protein
MEVWEATAAQARTMRLLGELPLVVISAAETNPLSPRGASPVRAARGPRFPLFARLTAHPRRHNPWVAGDSSGRWKIGSRRSRLHDLHDRVRRVGEGPP